MTRCTIPYRCTCTSRRLTIDHPPSTTPIVSTIEGQTTMTNRMPDTDETTVPRPTLFRRVSFTRRTARRSSLTGDSSSSSRNDGLFPFRRNDRQEPSSKSPREEVCDSMRMDALTGLQMPTPGYEGRAVGRNCSFTEGRVHRLPQRSQSSNGMPAITRTLPCRSQSSDGAPSAMFAKRTLPRHAPFRSGSSDLQDMAQLAFERQSLPHETQNARAVVSKAAHQQSPPRCDAHKGEFDFKSGSKDGTRQRPIITHQRCSLRRGIEQEYSSDGTPQRQAPSRAKSAPMAPYDSTHCPRGGRRRDVQRSSGTTSAGPNPSRPANDVHDSLSIEISPGVMARLRGAQETYQAVKNDLYIPTTCQGCQTDVCCIIDASYLLCPKCKSVCPIEGGNPDIPGGGIGLGFTLEDLRIWQAEILDGRSRDSQQSSNNVPTRSRRQSMW